MLDRYPVPPDLTVADLGQRDLYIQCPSCKVQYFHLGYNLALKLPPETPVARYVERHVCQRCSRPDRKVRCIGWIQEPPRSGAEGYNQRPTPEPPTRA